MDILLRIITLKQLQRKDKSFQSTNTKERSGENEMNVCNSCDTLPALRQSSGAGEFDSRADRVRDDGHVGD